MVDTRDRYGAFVGGETLPAWRDTDPEWRGRRPARELTAPSADRDTLGRFDGRRKLDCRTS